MEADGDGEVRGLDVAELYSVPKVMKEAEKFGLSVGETMDLRQGWDFSKEADRDRARTYVRR
jgi:hypothetical protein